LEVAKTRVVFAEVCCSTHRILPGYSENSRNHADKKIHASPSKRGNDTHTHNTHFTIWLLNIANWKITMFSGKIHYKWPFSIAMLVYQRVFGKSFL